MLMFVEGASKFGVETRIEEDCSNQVTDIRLVCNEVSGPVDYFEVRLRIMA